jgi:hypothetical protein
VNETVFLVISPRKVEKMTKTVPDTHRGEIVVKVHVTVKPEAFRSPTLVKEIVVEDPFDGLSAADVNLDRPFITEAERDLIRARRIADITGQLEDLGYKITPPDPPPPDDQPGT